MEKEARNEWRLKSFQQAMLMAVVLGGVVVVAATIPNAAQTAQIISRDTRRVHGLTIKRSPHSVGSRRKGLVTFVEEDGKALCTHYGERELILQMESEKTAIIKKRNGIDAGE